MRQKFAQLSVAEFFKRNRAVAGFTNPARSTYQVVRELLENSLDATENYGILPDIKLRIDVIGKSGNHDLIEVECQDNGIGIPPQHVPRAFAQVFYGSKYVNRQSRGLFGLGVKMAVIYAQITVGEPITVTTSPVEGDGKAHTFQLKVNLKENKPIVVSHKEEENGWHGTRVKLRFAGDWGRAKRYVLEYVKRTAVVTPFASIVFRYPDDGKNTTLRFERVIEEMPPPPKVKLPHPYGVDLETFKEMISEAPSSMKLYRFLASRFDRVGDATAVKFLQSLGITSKKTVGGLTESEVRKVWEAMQAFKWPRPSADGLSPLGERLIEAGLRRVFSPEFVASVQRPPSSYSGHAFIVEAGACWGGGVPVSDDKIPVLRFFNKIPVLFDENDCAVANVVQSIDLSHYGLQPPQPLVVLVHVVSTKIPFKGLGKEALADVPELEKEVELAVRESLRKIARTVAKKRREEEETRRKAEILKYADMIAEGLSYLSSADRTYTKELVVKLVETKG